MREIRFRAWAKNAKAMASWEKMKAECNRLSLIEDSDFIFMQYTGLKDKNGKEIYEGDILLPNNREVVYIDNGEYSRGVGFYTVCHRADGNCRKTPFTLCQTQTEYAKIIGNIYENPELIEK